MQCYYLGVKRSLGTEINQWFQSHSRKPLLLRGARQVGKHGLIAANRIKLRRLRLPRGFGCGGQKIGHGGVKAVGQAGATGCGAKLCRAAPFD